MSDFDSEEPTSLSEAASVSPAAASPERSPLAGAAGIAGAAVATGADAGSGVPPARGSAIPRTVSSFNVLESIAELENSIALCGEDPGPVLAKANPEQGQPPSQAASGGGEVTSPLAVAVAPGNPISPSLGTSLASHSFPSPALAAIPTLPPAPAPRPAPLSPFPTTPLVPAPAPTPASVAILAPVAVSAGADDKDFEEFAQQRLGRSPSVEIRSIVSTIDKSSTSQDSTSVDTFGTSSPSAASTVTAALDEAAATVQDEPFSYLSSTLAKELTRESPASATTTPVEEMSASQKEGNIAEMTTPDVSAEDIEGGDLTEAVLAGRRNSARALRIIQENTEILQRIIQAQQRRSSVSSEQGHASDGGGSPETLCTSASTSAPAGPTAGPAAAPAATPGAVTPNSERRASGPRRTASPAVSPVHSPPASPLPSPSSPGAAAATAERGRRILDDISALCHPTSPESPGPIAPVPITADSSNFTSKDASATDEASSTHTRRPFSPKIAQFLKSFDELLKPPSPPPTPKAPSPVASPLREVTLNELRSQEANVALGVDRGSSLNNLGVIRGVSPEPPLARRYTTHFIDALFEPPRTPSPLPTSASATYLSDVTIGDPRPPSTSSFVAEERGGDTTREKGRDVRKLPARDDERRKTTSYLTEKREVSQIAEHLRDRPTYAGHESTSPSRASFLSEDTRMRSTDSTEEGKKRLPCSDIPSVEFRRHLRSPSPSSRTVHRRSGSGNDGSEQFKESHMISHPPLPTQKDPSPVRSKEGLDDGFRQSYSPSTKTVRERSPNRSSEEFESFRNKSFSPSNKERSDIRANTLELIHNEINSGLRRSPSSTMKTQSDIWELSVEGNQTDIESTNAPSRSPASHRSFVGTAHIDERHERRRISPARREVKDSLHIEKEEDGDKFEERSRTPYSPGRVLLSVSDRDVTDSDNAGDYRGHSYSPSRKASELGVASRELGSDYKRHSYSPSHRSGSVDSEIKSRDNSQGFGEFQKQPFSPSRRAFSETTELKPSDSVDFSDLHKRGYSPRKNNSNEYDGRGDESYTSTREYRRYHSYSPSRKVNQERRDLKVEPFGSSYEESCYSDSMKTSPEGEMTTRSSEVPADNKKSVYLTSDSKRVEYTEYQRQQYSSTRKNLGTADDYMDDYQRRLTSPTKSIEPEATDFSYEEYKNQQYSPSEILELERKARLSIDTSDEYRPFSLTKISPANSNIADELGTISRENLQHKQSSNLKCEENESSRDFHQRLSSSPVRLKSRGSMEYLSDYQRRSYSPSKRSDVESNTDVKYDDDKVLSRSPSKLLKADHRIADIPGDFKHNYSTLNKASSDGRSDCCHDMSDDYQRTPYSPSKKSDMRSSDSLTSMDDFQRVSSPSTKLNLEHKRGEPFGVYENYKGRSYSPSKISLSEPKSGESLEQDISDDYTRAHYSPPKRSAEAKLLDSVEISEGYSHGSYFTSSRAAQSKPDHFEYRRRSKSPPKKTHLEDTEKGFGDYQRSSRTISCTDIPQSDGGGYGDFRRRSESPSRKWQDDLDSIGDSFSRSDKMTESRGRSVEDGRAGQGQARQGGSPPPVASLASSADRVPSLASASADASAPTPSSTADGEQAAPPQQQLPEATRPPSLRGPPASSAVARATPASASGTAARRRRGACDSEDAAPPPPRSGSGSGGPRASSASPRRRRRPSDTELLAGYRGTDLPLYAACCPPFVASPLSEAAVSQVARGVDVGSSLPPQPRARPASPIIGATFEERIPPPPSLSGRRSSAASVMPLSGTPGSPPPSPHYHASFHTKPCGGKTFSASSSSAFSRYPHRGRDRPTSLLLDGGGAAAAVAAFDAAPLYKSLSMLSLGEGDFDRPDVSSKLKKKSSDGKRSPRRRRTSSDLSSEVSSTAGSGTRTSPTTSTPKDFCANLPPLRPAGSSPMPTGSPAKSTSVFSPFPTRASMRQPKELGVRLGLYSRESEKSS